MIARRLRHALARVLAPDIFSAFRAFPHFENGEDVNPERIKSLASEWQEMVMGWAPSASVIDFTDQEGRMRRIVDAPGDWEAGISGGWTIDEDENWGAFDLNDVGDPLYPVRNVPAQDKATGGDA
jgi:hypothetical protein